MSDSRFAATAARMRVALEGFDRTFGRWAEPENTVSIECGIGAHDVPEIHVHAVQPVTLEALRQLHPDADARTDDDGILRWLEVSGPLATVTFYRR